MRVLKFGGTSVGTVESLRSVKAIVENIPEQCIVVVSALGGITDQLINTAKLAAEGGQSYMEPYQLIVERHRKVIAGAIALERQSEVLDVVNPLLEELGDLYKGLSLIRDLSERTLDVVVSYGERMSSVIVSRLIDGARHFESRNFIKTRRQFNKHILDDSLTQPLLQSTFAGTDFTVAVVPGFISTDATGRITNLGRGGSDYTAAILAAALNADILEIWTDVDGFMTADPRIIKSARVIPSLSFVEAMELCNFGAKVVYPPTIYPVFHKNIPIVIKNTFNPSAPGTMICDNRKTEESAGSLKGVSSIPDTSLITVTKSSVSTDDDVAQRAFNVLGRNGVGAFLVPQSLSGHITSFGVKTSEADAALSLLNDEFAAELQRKELNEIEVERELATVAVVGVGLPDMHRLSGRMAATLQRRGITVRACAIGAAETNISFVVPAAEIRNALSALHSDFF